eukprot:12404762-Karenia_brevis.AAC.1
MFKKNKKNLCTYKNPNQHNEEGHAGGPPWNTTDYGQIDYIITERRWRNSIFKIWSAPTCGISSDHFTVMAS